MQRRAALLCTLLFIATQSLLSQPRATVVGGLSFDFGNVYSSMKVKRLVTVRNDGTDTLEVSDVSSSCGCTGTLLSRPHIAPNDSATIEITFDPRRFNGKVEKAVSMKTNDPKNLKPHIMFTATIVKIVEVEPEYIVFRTTAGQPATDSIMLTNLSSRPVTITGISSPSAAISFGEFEALLPPSQPVQIPCTYTPGAGTPRNGDIAITTDDPNVPALALRFFALVKDSVSPETQK